MTGCINSCGNMLVGALSPSIGLCYLTYNDPTSGWFFSSTCNVTNRPTYHAWPEPTSINAAPDGYNKRLKQLQQEAVARGLQKDNPETINIILAMQLKGSLVGCLGWKWELWKLGNAAKSLAIEVADPNWQMQILRNLFEYWCIRLYTCIYVYIYIQRMVGTVGGLLAHVDTQATILFIGKS